MMHRRNTISTVCRYVYFLALLRIKPTRNYNNDEQNQCKDAVESLHSLNVQDLKPETFYFVGIKALTFEKKKKSTSSQTKMYIYQKKIIIKEHF